MPPPAPIKCPAPDCATQYQTPDNLPTYELVTTHLQMHIATNHATAPAAPGLHVPQPGQLHPQTSKVDKRSRPEVTQDMSEHNFRFFESEWNLYKRATGIQGQTLVDELWSCMSSDLKKLAFDQGSIDSLNTEDLMMARIKSLAVAVLHTAIHTVHLHEAKQISDETTKAFAARVRGIASNCTLHKQCTCGLQVSFLEETVYHVVLAGLRDRELQEACTTQALLNNIKDISSLVDFCSAKESGQMSASATVGGIKSAYQAGKFRHHCDHPPPPPPATTQPTTHCHNCGGKKHGDGGRAAREKDCKAYSVECNKCGKKGHYSSQCKSKPKVAAAETEKDSTDGAVATNGAVTFGFYAIHAIPTSNRFEELTNLPQETPQTVASISPAYRKTVSMTSSDTSTTSPTSSPRRRNNKWSRRGQRKGSYTSPKPPPMTSVPPHLVETLRSNSMLAGISSTIPLCHMLYDSISGWREAPPMESPTLLVRLEVHMATYSALQLPTPMASNNKCPLPGKVRSVADSGAQMDILALHELENMRVLPSSLLPVRAQVTGASHGSSINIIGGILLSVKGINTRSRSSLQLFYVSDNVSRTYLSLSTLKALGVVSPDFPRIPMMEEEATVAATGPKQCTNDGVVAPGQTPCSCPARTLSPTAPATLPCAATPENVPQLKEFILD